MFQLKRIEIYMKHRCEHAAKLRLRNKKMSFYGRFFHVDCVNNFAERLTSGLGRPWICTYIARQISVACWILTPNTTFLIT